MKKEAKILVEKSIESLILSVEHFNRPWDNGRIETTLILLDHSFEMLLKAAIVHRGQRIRKPREQQTLGFDECVRKALSDGSIRFLTREQALLLQTINSLRDAAYHHILEISEQMLYLHAQGGLTLFADILSKVFGRDLRHELPERVLPICTTLPTDITTLFQNEVEEVNRLLRPKTRKRMEATARLRSLSIVDRSMQGEKTQPSDAELSRLADKISRGSTWDDVFPGLASIQIRADGYGPSLDLRIEKKEGTPVHLVPEGTPGATVVAVKRVDELGFYNLNCTALSKLVGLNMSQTLAVIWYLDIKSDSDCFKEVVIGKSRHKLYSQKAIARIKTAIPKLSIDEVSKRYQISIKSKK